MYFFRRRLIHQLCSNKNSTGVNIKETHPPSEHQNKTGADIRQEPRQHGKNLINPDRQTDPIAYGFSFPKEWDVTKLYSLLDPSRKQIKQIKLINDKLGRPSGKVLFTFKDVKVMEKYVKKYNEDFIVTDDSTYRVILKPFELKTEIKKKENLQYDDRFGVSINNLDYDIDRDQLQRLAEDFGKVEHIDIFMRENKQNRGFAKVYFGQKKAAEDFQYFADGLVYKERKLKCSVIKNDAKTSQKKKVKEVPLPKFLMQSNRELYERMVQEQNQKSKSVDVI